MGMSLRTRLGQTSGFGKALVKGRKEPDSYIPQPASPSDLLAKPLSPSTSIFDLEATQYPNPSSTDYLEEIVPEIIVRTDDMELIDMDSASESVSTPQEPIGYVYLVILSLFT